MSSRELPARIQPRGIEAQPLPFRQVGSSSIAEPVWQPNLAISVTPSLDLEHALREAQLNAQAAIAQARHEGLQQGRNEGQQMARTELAPLMDRLARTIADLSETRDAFRHEAEGDVVRLALGIARRILHRELSIDPDALTGLVRVALGKFEARELHRVLVSPDDHPAVSKALQDLKLPRRVEIIADPTLERGAALFETVKGTLDSSIDTQLDEIERGLLDVLGKDGRHG